MVSPTLLLAHPFPAWTVTPRSWLISSSSILPIFFDPVSYITDIRLLASKDDLDLSSDEILASGDDLHSGIYPTLPPLWLAYKTQVGEPSDAWLEEDETGEEEIITEIDVLYGDGEVSLFLVWPSLIYFSRANGPNTDIYHAKIGSLTLLPAMVRLLEDQPERSRLGQEEETSRTRLARYPERRPYSSLNF
jgi:hypothetical protein